MPRRSVPPPPPWPLLALAGSGLVLSAVHRRRASGQRGSQAGQHRGLRSRAGGQRRHRRHRLVRRHGGRLPGAATSPRPASTACSSPGPAGHNNIPPAPGLFGTGHDDKMPGLVVLTSTTSSTLPGFSGPGTNLAGLFNLTGVTNRDAEETELWDTWLVGAPVAGSNVDTVLTVAVVNDLNHDGIYNDAPDVVTDANDDGRIDLQRPQGPRRGVEHRAGAVPHQRRPGLDPPGLAGGCSSRLRWCQTAALLVSPRGARREAP